MNMISRDGVGSVGYISFEIKTIVWSLNSLLYRRVSLRLICERRKIIVFVDTKNITANLTFW